MKLVVSVLAFLLISISAVFAESAPMSVAGTTTISVEEAAELFDAEVPFVDVRKASDFDAGRIPAAVNIDVKGDFTEAALAAVAGKNDKVVFYCNGEKCLLSSTAAEMAVAWGWTNIQYFRGGFPAWEAAGLPIE